MERSADITVTNADIVVVGAGLAGLVAAATAAESIEGQRLRVVVIEGAQPGGRARTDERNGFKFNQGPHAVYLQGAGRKVMLGLGIDPTGGPPASKHTFLFEGGEVYPMPASATKLMASKLLTARGKAQIAKFLPGIGKVDAAALSSISAAQWLDGLDLQPEARKLVSMLMRTATYVDPDVMPISADAAVRQMQIAVDEGVRYIDGGWQTMVDALLAVCAARASRWRRGPRRCRSARSTDTSRSAPRPDRSSRTRRSSRAADRRRLSGSSATTRAGVTSVTP